MTTQDPNACASYFCRLVAVPLNATSEEVRAAFSSVDPHGLFRRMVDGYAGPTGNEEYWACNIVYMLAQPDEMYCQVTKELAAQLRIKLLAVINPATVDAVRRGLIAGR